MSAESIDFVESIDRLVTRFEDKKKREEDFRNIRPPINFQPNIANTRVFDAAGSMGIFNAKRTQAYRDGQQLAQTFKSTMDSTLSHGVFKSWLRSAGSSTIVIVCEPTPATPVALASTLAELATKISGHLVWTHLLTFFCGLHEKQPDGDDALQAMFKSFIVQLVAKEADVQGILGNFTEEDLAILSAGTAKDLCDLFVKVVKNVRAGTIFCIIDSIGYLQGNDGGHCGYVMAALNALVHYAAKEKSRRNSQLIFKLLVTASGTNHNGNLDMWFPREPFLNIVVDDKGQDSMRVFSR
ncbi:hypothetical protein SLS54_004614 [Diplodia seriata]